MGFELRDRAATVDTRTTKVSPTKPPLSQRSPGEFAWICRHVAVLPPVLYHRLNLWCCCWCYRRGCSRLLIDLQQSGSQQSMYQVCTRRCLNRDARSCIIGSPWSQSPVWVDKKVVTVTRPVKCHEPEGGFRDYNFPLSRNNNHLKKKDKTEIIAKVKLYSSRWEMGDSNDSPPLLQVQAFLFQPRIPTVLISQQFPDNVVNTRSLSSFCLSTVTFNIRVSGEIEHCVRLEEMRVERRVKGSGRAHKRLGTRSVAPSSDHNVRTTAWDCIVFHHLGPLNIFMGSLSPDLQQKLQLWTPTARFELFQLMAQRPHGLAFSPLSVAADVPDFKISTTPQ
ncbi:hypothetical protein RRG08_035047 [Elysia crispata]|uniref:Uncharacterized protein n=1 Tax=Elysia crispata TaxID=231223 RepID=A0AAE0ZS99_9GAST|nr:hypothetical protein RRG08_035047 [Elysia crispata]